MYLPMLPSLVLSRSRAPANLFARTGFWLSLGLIQAVVLTWLFELPWTANAWRYPFFALRHAATWAILSGAAFVLIVWPRREELMSLWRDEQIRHAWGIALTVNLALFAMAAVASILLTRHVAVTGELPALLLSAYALLLVAGMVSFIRVDIPLVGMLRIARPFVSEIAVAAAGGLGVIALSLVARHGWQYLASGTLVLTHAILGLYERDIAIDAVARTLRIKDFGVEISEACSGTEGIGLVVAFVSIYLWAFRSQLRFPRAFVLYPVGIAGIWLLNSVRIALLTSLGAHISPEIAVKGFHSQAGWMAFLVATLGLMAAAQSSSLLAVGSGPIAKQPKTATGTRLAEGFLVPFMALMLASMVLAAMAPHDRALYALKVVAVLAALWLYRDVYRTIAWRAPAQGILAGLLVGVAWIATDPSAPADSTLGEWLAAQGPWLAAVWLLWRIVGSCITVPIAEELAFRGFLHRWIIDRDFARVSPAQMSLIALVVSSLLFGLMHERWIAGALAGAVFALVMYRTRDLAGPIVAHMAANALICAWALAFRQWTLL